MKNLHLTSFYTPLRKVESILEKTWVNPQFPNNAFKSPIMEAALLKTNTNRKPPTPTPKKPHLGSLPGRGQG